jgi:SAM-dependent methyltransferase
MIELIEKLSPGARVLDLGAGPGSFEADRPDVMVVRLDLEAPASRRRGEWVAGSADRLPFRDACFHLVVSNHSLEHFTDLDAALTEVGRVMEPGGTFYVAVPDAGSLTDRVYRWLGKGGGHVNAFRSAEEVEQLVARRTGLRHCGTRPLYSGFSFLNRNNIQGRPQRKLALFAGGNEKLLAVMAWLLRSIDQRFHTGLSLYGWAFGFGASAPPHAGEVWINVCVRCGAGLSETCLRRDGAIGPLPKPFNWYRCPACGGLNLLTPE